MLLKAKRGLVKSNVWSLRDFHKRRNRVLIIRNARGLGDIFMHRMMFEDFKRVMPDMHLVFACPLNYHCMLKDHPFIDELADSITVNRSNYLVSYDTSLCCIRYESKHPVMDKHRADIWAEHCGVILTRHNTFLPFLKEEQLQWGRFQVRQARGMALSLPKPNGPNVLFVPVAYEPMRSLRENQIRPVVDYLRSLGCFVYSTNLTSIPVFDSMAVPTLCGYGDPEWLSFVHAADYVVTVDTAVFHYAGAIKKPLVGVFTHVDGKYRGLYYDFVLVQKHRDNGDWPCGPCYNYLNCTHPKCIDPTNHEERPCLTELTADDIIVGIKEMFRRWPQKLPEVPKKPHPVEEWNGMCPRCGVPCPPSNSYCCPKCGWDAYV